MLHFIEDRHAFYCGIWHTRHRLTAAVVDERGALRARSSAERTPGGLWDLITTTENAHGLDGVFLVTDELLRSNTEFEIVATQHGCRVLIAPAFTVHQLRRLTGSSTQTKPGMLALVMARLPLCGPVHYHLSQMRRHLEIEIPF